MANINTRAKDETITLLKELAERTGNSQAQVIEKALDLYKDYLEIQERRRQEILEKM